MMHDLGFQSHPTDFIFSVKDLENSLTIFWFEYDLDWNLRNCRKNSPEFLCIQNNMQ
jgi:hypothetical protein